MLRAIQCAAVFTATTTTTHNTTATATATWRERRWCKLVVSAAVAAVDGDGSGKTLA